MAIPANGRDNVYRLTGNTARTFTLPDASGGGSVPNGWDAWFTAVAASLTIDGNGADTIDGACNFSNCSR